jgi:hypothetical protein
MPPREQEDRNSEPAIRLIIMPGTIPKNSNGGSTMKSAHTPGPCFPTITAEEFAQFQRLKAVNAELVAALNHSREYCNEQCAQSPTDGALWAQCSSIAIAALAKDKATACNTYIYSSP